MASNNSLLITFLSVFLALGFVMPFITSEFGSETSTADAEGFMEDVGQQDYTDVSAFEIILSMASIFFWSFGAVPVWVNLILMIPRVIFYVILYDKVRGI